VSFRLGEFFVGGLDGAKLGTAPALVGMGRFDPAAIRPADLGFACPRIDAEHLVR
jgi:hypothetical protein